MGQGLANGVGMAIAEAHLAATFNRPGYDVIDHYTYAIVTDAQLEAAWASQFKAYRFEHPKLAVELQRRLSGDLPAGWRDSIPHFPADAKGLATRIASGKIINALAAKIPELLGGSVDLAPSNKTWIDDAPPFQADILTGCNFHFGVREHGMGAILNGMAVHGGPVPYGLVTYILPPI